MPHPEDYPDEYRESIFAWSVPGESGPGSLTFVFTRGGGRLNVYVMQYLGRHPDGDLFLPADTGVIDDTSYNPDADDAFVPEDMTWGHERPRLSQPVRDWLDSRDMLTADRDRLVETLAHEKNFDLSRGWD